MTDAALRRFLGLPAGADSRAVLGLPPAPAPLNAARVQRALAERLARLDRHPDARSAEAESVRTRIRSAAAQLLAAGSATAPAPSSAVQASSGPAGPKAPVAPGARSARPGPDASAPPVVEAREASEPPTRTALPRAPRPPIGSGSALDAATAAPQAPAPLRRPPAGAAALDQFDRMVLATLVAGGGWNARSRRQLVALAAAHGVGVDGLMKVVTGLAAHARSRTGGWLAAGVPQDVRPLPAAPRQQSSAPLERIAANLQRQTAHEAGADAPWRLWTGPRIAAIVALAVLTLASVAGMVWVMVRPTSLVMPPPEGVKVADVGAEDGGTAGSDPLDDIRDHPPTPGGPRLADGQAPAHGADASAKDADAQGADRSGPPGAPEVKLAKFPRPPTFKGERRPPKAVELLERASSLPAAFDTVGRRLTLGGEETSVAVDRDWSAAIAEAGGCWPLLSPQQRKAVTEAMVTALRGATTPSLIDRMLAALAPDPPPRTAEELWLASFKAGALSEILARGALLPPAAVQRAGELLSATLAAAVQGGVRGFDDGAGRVLDQAVPSMVVRLPRDPGFADAWEGWIEAQRAVRDGADLQRAYAGAVGTLLVSGYDFAAAGPAADVLGRFVELLDLNDDRGVRSEFLRWMRDPAAPAQALWVLTSLMARDPGIRWFGSDLVVLPQATPADRDAMASFVEMRWAEPAPASRPQRPPVLAPSDAVAAWQEALRWLEGEAARSADPRDAMRTLLLASMLNEAAACFEAGQEQRGRDLVEQVRSFRDPAQRERWPRRGLVAAPARGTPAGTDGEWAQAYEQAERRTEERLSLLRRLRTIPGGDLGPVDAETLVKAAVRGEPAEVRSVARGVLAESFRHGPGVMLALLDQLPEASAVEELSHVIAQLTDRTLPSARSPEWPRAARLALLSRALSLRTGGEGDLDVESAALVETLAARRQLLPPTAAVASPVGAAPAGAAPQEAMSRLVDGWRARAGAVLAQRPVPGTLAELDRRRALRLRLAPGAVTLFIAEQIDLLELAAYVLAAEAPWLESAVTALLESASGERQRLPTAMEQAAATELARARVWELAFTGDPSGTQRGAAAEDPALGASRPAEAETPGAPAADRPTRPDSVSASAGRWATRLAALDPTKPLAYFELAEEIADQGGDDEQRRLARRLFALAGALAPDLLARSACLALADLAEEGPDKERLVLAAMLLDRRAGAPQRIDGAAPRGDAAMALSEAMSFYRRGLGPRAQRRLEADGVAALLEAHGAVIDGGVDRLREDLRRYRGQVRPALTPEAVTDVLRLEIGLLAGRARPWSSDLLITGNRPLAEVDPGRLEELFGVDASRPCFRDGGWVAAPEDVRSRDEAPAGAAPGAS